MRPAFLPAPFAALVLSLSLAAGPAAALTLSEVESALKSTETMIASFRQVAADGTVQTGTMTLKRPGRVRFDYGPKSPILVVADGYRLTFVDYKVKQVSQWPLSETPLRALLDPAADLSKVARVLPDEQSPVPGAVAVEAFDRKRPDLGRMLFLLKPDPTAPGGQRLIGWRVIDAQNNLTVVELSDLRWNVEVANSTFRFSDPRPRPKRPGVPS
jgi:outer membrane lipoprotein-sorting protein